MKILIPEDTRNELYDFLNSIAGSNILFVGGTGLIGRWFLECFDTINLASSSVDITVTGRSRPNWLKNTYGSIRVRFEKLDLQEPRQVLAVLRKISTYNQIWFFAAPTARETFARVSGFSKYKMALASASFLMECVERVSPDIVVLASSGIAVSSNNEVAEKTSGAPDLFGVEESLAHGKRLLERACWELSHQFNLSVSAVRIFSCYGPYLPTDLHYAFGNFIGNALRGEDIVVNSNGKSKRSYIYASDLIAMLCLEISRQLTDFSANSRFNVVNLGSDVSMSIAELARLIGSFSPHKNVTVKILSEVDESAGNRVRVNYVPDMSYSKKLGIYRDRVSITEGIESILS